MTQPIYSKEETGERGDKIYEQQLRATVETEANIGKIIAIDIETGDYEIDADLLQAGRRLKARHPDSPAWAKRIGYDAVYAVGGSLTRTEQ